MLTAHIVRRVPPVNSAIDLLILEQTSIVFNIRAKLRYADSETATFWGRFAFHEILTKIYSSLQIQ